MRWTLLLVATLFATASAAVSVGATGPDHGHADHSDEALLVDAAWSPAVPPSVRMRALYFTLANRGVGPATLIGVDSPDFESVDLHRSSVTDGLAVMSEVAQVTIPAGDRLILAPGGLHVMLSGARRRLEVGDRFRVTLRFESRASLTFSVPVHAPDDRPTAAGHDGHQM